MFLPIKSDFPLPRFPILTLLVCVICIFVFLKQQSDWAEFEVALERYCDEPRHRLTEMVIKKLEDIGDAGFCGQVMYEISSSEKPYELIEELVSELGPLAGYGPDDSREYVTVLMNDELRHYRSVVPEDPDSGVAYYTGSWNPWHMLTSSFAHADWGHIVFNLIFFFAFAATVEVLIGGLAFATFIVANSVLIGVVGSVVAFGEHYWTLGLSGIVMGMIGLYTYLLPRGKIRCYYWFIVIFGSVAVPAWMLALWYIGGDMYQLFAKQDHGVVNVLAHVTGGLGGYEFGALFLKKSKKAAEDLQRALDKRDLRPKFN